MNTQNRSKVVPVFVVYLEMEVDRTKMLARYEAQGQNSKFRLEYLDYPEQDLARRIENDKPRLRELAADLSAQLMASGEIGNKAILARRYALAEDLTTVTGVVQ